MAAGDEYPIGNEWLVNGLPCKRTQPHPNWMGLRFEIAKQVGMLLWLVGNAQGQILQPEIVSQGLSPFVQV